MLVAALNYCLTDIDREEQFYENLWRALESVKDADLIVLPELCVLELCALSPELQESDVAEFLLQFESPYEAFLMESAAKLGSTLVGGSHFRWYEGRAKHGILVSTPEGATTFQPKNVLTQWELQEWGLSPHSWLMHQPDPRLGVLICYDSEFPEGGRALAETGISVLAVPSYTESDHGLNRVQIGCRARALENQIFVASACLGGTLGREPVRNTSAQAAIFAPPVPPFPANGILAISEKNKPGAAMYRLDFDLLNRCREVGDVRNWNDRKASDWSFR